MSDDHITEVFAEIVNLSERLGVKRINELPGCWEVALGDGFWFALNGHAESTRCSTGANVLPFHAYVTCNDWPCMLVSPRDGVRIGDEGTEAALIAALKAGPAPTEPVTR